MARNFISVDNKTLNGLTLGNKPLITSVTQQGTTHIRHFSGTDVDVYIGDACIGEAEALNFTLQQNAMPVIGYNSFTANDIILGSRIVSGQISINFASAGYLYAILNSSGAQISCGTSSSPMWDKEIDLTLSYGNAKEGADYSTMITLLGVKITGMAQQYSYNGEPVGEVYTFQAKDISFSLDSSNAKNPPTPHTSSSSVISTVEKITISKALYVRGGDTQLPSIDKAVSVCNPTADIRVWIDVSDNISVSDFRVKPQIPENSEIPYISLSYNGSYYSGDVSSDFSRSINTYINMSSSFTADYMMSYDNTDLKVSKTKNGTMTVVKG